MKFKKLISLLLVALMIVPSFGAYAATEDENIFYATEDTYIASGDRLQNKNYGNDATMLFGSAYNRTAFLKFDLSGADLDSFKGALLELNVKATDTGALISIYTTGTDWSEKSLTAANAAQEYEFVIGYNVKSVGTTKIAFSLNRALEKAKADGTGVIALALKADKGSLSISSSESSDKSLRPKLTLTEDSAFIKGQLDFAFPQVTKDMLKTELTKAVAKGHPYIIATKDKIERIKEYAFGKDEILTTQYALIKEDADACLGRNIRTLPDNTSSQSYIGDAINSWYDVMHLSLTYLVGGDERYAERAYKQAEYFCNLKTWGTFQYIDNVQVAFAVALCYDWLYDWLDDSQKECLVNGLRKLHLDTVSDLLKNPSKPAYNDSFYRWFFSNNNHTLMDNSLTFIAALAIAETDIDFAAELMAGNLKNLESPFAKWYPDSAWFEGITYWNFAGPYTTRLLLSMQTAFGHCFGYDEIDCLVNVADFPIYTQSDLGGFVWGDSFQDHDVISPIMYCMGSLKKDVGLMKYSLENCKVTTSSEAVFALCYDPDIDYNEDAFFSLDKLFRNVDIVTMRDTFDGEQSTWAAMGVQEIRPNNGMANCGSLGFDALGEHWIMNAGRETYYDNYWDFDGARWTYYRTRAEAKSCLVINPSAYCGQNIDAHDTINVFESADGGAFAITDLTETYLGQANSYKRGIGLFNNRNSFVVQDEFVLTEPSEVYSFFNIYRGDIKILDDGKSAIVTKNNKKMYVTVDSDKEFEFTAMECEPLPTSPVPNNPNSSNREFKKLALHFNNIDSGNIRVTFTPYLCDEELTAIDCAEFVPMADWTVSETIKEKPVLQDLKIEGLSIDGFNAANRCYDIDSEIDVSAVTPVYDSSKYDAKVRKDETNGSVSILLTDKNDPANMNSYSLAVPYVPTPSFVDTTGMAELKIKNTVAPVPQPENNIANLYDGDLSTRWSAEGAGTEMKLTLDSKHKIGCIGMNHYEGSTNRIQYFDVEVSVDGTKWTKAGRFESCGITDDMEYYDLKNVDAKYIKIIFYATNITSWNSVCELKVFGK